MKNIYIASFVFLTIVVILVALYVVLIGKEQWLMPVIIHSFPRIINELSKLLKL